MKTISTFFSQLRFFNLLFVLIVTSSVLKAQTTENPVIWEYNIEQTTDGLYEITATAQIDEAWYMYGRNFDEGGPLPLEITFECNDQYELIGEINESKPAIEEEDEIFGITIKHFSGTVSFTQIVKVKGKPVKIPIYIDGQACRKVSGVCVAVSDEHIFEIPAE